MQQPNCNQHEHLMLDLSRGLLSDEAFAAAEATRRSCPTCASWWEAHLTGPEVGDLDRVVKETFAGFTPPHQRRLSEKYPWAVAAVLALAASLVLQPDRPASTDTEQVSEAENLIIREMFNLDQNSDGVVDLSDVTIAVNGGVATDRADRQPLFGGDLESGDLSAWTSANQPEKPGATS